MSRSTRFVALLSSTLLVSLTTMGCGSSAALETPGAPTAPSPKVKISAAYPNLLHPGGVSVFPTYISHVLSSEKYPLALVTIENGGGGATFEVRVVLPGFGEARARTVALGPGETQTVSLSPSLDHGRLFQLTSSVPASLDTAVARDGATIYRDSKSIEISGRDTVLWSDAGRSLTPLVAAMITAHDRAGSITSLVRATAERMRSTAMVGISHSPRPRRRSRFPRAGSCARPSASTHRRPPRSRSPASAARRARSSRR